LRDKLIKCIRWR